LFNSRLRAAFYLEVKKMPSTAISAQGSKLEIGTGSGAAKTISGAAVGYPTILTSTAHGLANGDVVAIAAIVGTLSAINGMSFTVKNATANTFAIEYNSTGLAYTSGGTATPTTWTQIKNLKTFSGFDGQASELDRTNLDSVAKENVLGLVDYGQFTVDLDYDYADAGQAALLASQVSGAIKTFKLTLPDAHTASFSAYVKKIGAAGGVDQIVKRQGVAMRISGAVTWA
jgi:hypothetical protein